MSLEGVLVVIDSRIIYIVSGFSLLAVGAIKVEKYYSSTIFTIKLDVFSGFYFPHIKSLTSSDHMLYVESIVFRYGLVQRGFKIFLWRLRNIG